MANYGKIKSHDSAKGADTITPEKGGGDRHAIYQGWPLAPQKEFPSWT